MKKIKNGTEIHPIHKLMSGNIIRLRKKSGITQLELAKKTGLTHNFINDLENGKKGVSAESIRKLCGALNAEPFQLFMPIDFQENEIQYKINNYLDKMDEMKKELENALEYSIFMKD